MRADITIVGLGPGPADLRTLAAQQVLDDATHIYVRTHGDIDLQDLLDKPNVTDLGEFHDRNTANRWLLAARAVIAGAKQEPVVLAVPGHPRFGEGLVRQTLAIAAEQGLTTRVIDGISAIDMLSAALDIDPILDRVQLVTARELTATNDEAPFDGGLIYLSPRRPILITHVYDSTLIEGVQGQLQRILPGNHAVEMIHAAGLASERRSSTTLADLADVEGGPLLALYVPAQDELDATRDPATLQHIVATLRRDDGCPWDRKQTNATLAQSLADEVYEVIDAIRAGDDANLAEELGDLLLLIMMHAQIAEERNAFRLEDVYHGISTKIVRRHPHVFGDLAAANADEVVGLWQQVKSKEKMANPDGPAKAADGQPHSMPALTRAPRVLARHPLPVPASSAEERQQALLSAVAAIVVAGADPEMLLRIALAEHVTAANRGSNQGVLDASR